jgi:hypothetical protein
MSDKAKDVAGADVVITSFDNIAGIPGAPITGIIVQVGEKGDLTRTHASAAATAIINARRAYPDAVVTLSFDGFDDDQREIWDIPQARTYLLDVIATAFQSLGFDLRCLNLDEASNVLVGMCSGALRIVGRDPATGNYLMEPIKEQRT